jgi:hypothetical protein
MSTTVGERDADELAIPESRTIRALTQTMAVTREAPGLWLVQRFNGDGELRSYDVDTLRGRCTCPDHQYRGEICKHLRRIAFEQGWTPLPDWIDDAGKLAPGLQPRLRRQQR